MSKKLLLPLLTALLFTACAKIVVTPVTSAKNKLKKEGLFYALPKTVVRVQLKVDKTTQNEAPFAKYAPIFAPDGDRVCELGKCKTTVTVQQGATFSTFGEPDSSQIYLVEFSGGGAVDQSLNMTWNEAGLLSAASSTVTNRATDIAIAGVKLVAGFGTRGGLGGESSVDEKTSKIEFKPCNPESDKDAWVLPIIGQDERTRDILVANYCAQDKEKFRDALSDSDKEPLTRATDQYNAQVGAFIVARSDLLAGKGVQSLDPIALINKLESIIDQKLRALFLGTTTTVTWDGSLDLHDLKAEDIGRPKQILKIVPGKGIAVDESLLSPGSKPIPAALVAAVSDKAQPVAVKVEYYPKESDQLFHRVRTAVESPGGDRSFRYRLPAQVQASLDHDGKNFGRGLLAIAQLGHVVSLPARRNSKALTYDLTMIEATGGLKGFKLGSTGAVDAATIDALAATGNSVLDARNAARKAEEAAEDELTLLTRQQTILKLKDEICTIQKKYGLDCTIQP